jgi:hypothetical protein
MNRFEIVDEHMVIDAEGVEHDVREAIAELPWVDQLCPLMPHQYDHRSKAEPLAYGVAGRQPTSGAGRASRERRGSGRPGGDRPRGVRCPDDSRLMDPSRVVAA